MADAASGPALADAYKEARIAIQHQADVEKGVIRSASVLWTNLADGQKKTAAFVPLIDQRAASLLNEVKTAYQLQAAQRNVAAAEPVQSPDERVAANLVVEPLAGAGAAGGGGRAGGRGAGGGGGGGGAGRGRGATGPSLPEEYNAEFAILLGKGMSALQIRDFLSGEFTPLPLTDVMTVLRARESQGSIKLTQRAGR